MTIFNTTTEHLLQTLSESFPMKVDDQESTSTHTFGAYFFHQILHVDERTSVTQNGDTFTLKFDKARTVAITTSKLSDHVGAHINIGHEVKMLRNRELGTFEFECIDLVVSTKMLGRTMSYSIPLKSMKAHHAPEAKSPSIAAEVEIGKMASHVLLPLFKKATGKDIPQALLIKPQHVVDATKTSIVHVNA